MEIEMQIFSEIFLLIFSIISLIVGIKIILKYQEQKEKVFITAGLTWIFISSAWWDDVIEFVLSNLGGIVISTQDSYLITMVTDPLVSIAMICWVFSFCVMVYPNWKKKGVLIYLPFSLLYYVMTFISKLLGYMGDDDDSIFLSISFMLLLFFIVSFIVTGLFLLITREEQKIQKSVGRESFCLLLLSLFQLDHLWKYYMICYLKIIQNYGIFHYFLK